ncbi:MAG TPA: formimidoylglutamate deiminase [Gemmatimonadales bacterium]|nr:formimidoylglutamate deiminase [Gemmatimonadales bacterium]
MTSPTRALEAELVWTGAEFEEGIRISLTAAGRIAAVEPVDQATPASAALRVERLPGIALLPGFVDAHSHAFQRGLRGRGESFPAGAGSFWTWREAMYALVDALDPTTLRRLSARAFNEMRDAGITTVGEFHYVHHHREGDFALDEAIVAAAADAGIRMVLLYSFYATGAPGRPLAGGQRRFATPSVDQFWRQLDRVAQHLDPAVHTAGVAPHSIRAAGPQEIGEIYREARRRAMPVHLHVEEQRREIEESLAAYGRTPMAVVLDATGDAPFTAVHCTHTSPEDMKRFLAAGGTVCACPLTEGNLGDGIPSLAQAHRVGHRLALGTDSNNRLAMLEEMRWLEYGQRLAGELRGSLSDPGGDVAPTLLAAATSGGADALGVPAGRLAPGLWADAVAIDLTAPPLAEVPRQELLAALVFGAGNEVVAGTYVGGLWRPSSRTSGT